MNRLCDHGDIWIKFVIYGSDGMKSKRWKRRNRRDRPEWVQAYNLCDFQNKMNWRGYKRGWKLELLYSYPVADWLYKKCGLAGHREIKL
jgi:hypothetical protein